ncbi:MAG: hypothetical protein WCO13_08540 [Bacteroidota bacterium]
MKYIIFLFFILTFHLSTAQNINYILKDVSSGMNEIKNYNKIDSLPKFYIIDNSSFDSLMKSSTKKYKIIYNFSHKCSSSREVLPKLLEFISQNVTIFELYLIIGYRYDNVFDISNYLKNKIHFYEPAYFLDIKKYGKRKNPFSRLDKFIKQYCPQCEYRKMGFSSYFVFDKDNKIILHTNWEYDSNALVNELKKLP